PISLFLELEEKDDFLVVQKTRRAAQQRGVRRSRLEQLPQIVLVGAVLELRVVEVGRQRVGAIGNQREVIRLDDQIAFRGHTAAPGQRDRAAGELYLQPADDADADQMGTRQALLLVEIVEDVVQMAAGEHLVRFENRKMIKQDFHGDPRTASVRGWCAAGSCPK